MTSPIQTDDRAAELERLAERVEACTEPTRELADEVLLACGWQLNHDADEIAAWRINPGVVEGEDGEDYPVTLEDRMRWACWYKPGNQPFRDSWLDGHYRPDPLASLDAAMTLVPERYARDVMLSISPMSVDMGGKDWRAALGGMKNRSSARTPALALCAAALKARASLSRDLAGEG